MAEQSFMYKISSTFRSWIDTMQGKPKPEHPLIRYGTPILFSLVAVAAFSAIYVGYRWYAQGREQKAQYACSKLLDEYMQLQKESAPDFTNFAMKAMTVYADYSTSAVAPYIGLLAVDAQLKSGARDQARATMEIVAAAVSSNKLVGDLFRTKQALLMIDSVDVGAQEEGFKQLALLADNADNPHRDYALYHLGLYHWNKNDIQQARIAWQDLVESQEVELRAPSPWVDLVADKLATIPTPVPAPSFVGSTALETL